MFKPHTKFKVSTITCNENMKDNAKCKNSHFEPPFGDLGITHRFHLWLDGKRIVDFLLVTSKLFSLAIIALALLSEICRNHTDIQQRLIPALASALRGKKQLFCF